MPTGVAISSLLNNNPKNVIYSIKIIVSGDVTDEDKNLLNTIINDNQSTIEFINIDFDYNHAVEVRGITRATYFRLRIPWLLKDLQKIIYCDGDVIFKKDLSGLYNIDLDNNYLAAVKDFYAADSFKKYVSTINLEWDQYFNAGVLLLNLDKMREDKLNFELNNLSKKDFKFQDQDILNIACKGKVKFLDPIFNFNVNSYARCINNPDFIEDRYSIDLNHLMKDLTIIHYCGDKPWKKYRDYFVSEWLSEFRTSVFYDAKFEYELQRAIFHPKLSTQYLKQIIKDQL